MYQPKHFEETRAEVMQALVATQPLTTGEPWVTMAPGELRVFSGGQAAFAGPCTAG